MVDSQRRLIEEQSRTDRRTAAAARRDAGAHRPAASPPSPPTDQRRIARDQDTAAAAGDPSRRRLGRGLSGIVSDSRQQCGREGRRARARQLGDDLRPTAGVRSVHHGRHPRRRRGRAGRQTGRRDRDPEPLQPGFPHADRRRLRAGVHRGGLRRKREHASSPPRVRAVEASHLRADVVDIFGSGGGARHHRLRRAERDGPLPPATGPLDVGRQRRACGSRWRSKTPIWS